MCTLQTLTKYVGIVRVYTTRLQFGYSQLTDAWHNDSTVPLYEANTSESLQHSLFGVSRRYSTRHL